MLWTAISGCQELSLDTDYYSRHMYKWRQIWKWAIMTPLTWLQRDRRHVHFHVMPAFLLHSEATIDHISGLDERILMK